MARAETRAATHAGRGTPRRATAVPQGPGARPVPRRAQSLLGALTLLLLAGCGGSPPAADVSAVPAAPPPPPAPAKPLPASASITPGFTPLPSPQQVVGPLAKGRLDPFAPIVQPGKVLITLPNGLRFNGVIRSSGQSKAMVELDGQAGPVCLGARGFCPDSGTPPMLPPGWTVAAIDVQNGLLSLRQGKQRFTLSL